MQICNVLFELVNEKNTNYLRLIEKNFILENYINKYKMSENRNSGFALDYFIGTDTDTDNDMYNVKEVLRKNMLIVGSRATGKTSCIISIIEGRAWFQF